MCPTSEIMEPLAANPPVALPTGAGCVVTPIEQQITT